MRGLKDKVAVVTGGGQGIGRALTLRLAAEGCKVAIGGLLDRMESAGFVERRADEHDGRARRVYLTRAGSRMVIAIRASVETVEMEILSRISNADLEQATETLRTLKETVLEILGGDAEASDSADIDTFT